MEQLQVYKCAKSSLVVEILADGCDDISCCGEKMILQQENTVDAAVEKHVPVLEGDANGIVVKVGSVAHPMTEEHYIQWIEVVNGAWVNRKMLKPGDKPEAEFYVPKQDGLIVRAYCNLHGLWRA